MYSSDLTKSMRSVYSFKELFVSRKRITIGPVLKEGGCMYACSEGACVVCVCVWYVCVYVCSEGACVVCVCVCVVCGVCVVCVYVYVYVWCVYVCSEVVCVVGVFVVR